MTKAIITPELVNPYAERFWERAGILHPWDCYEWQALKSEHGYGLFSMGGENYFAHRVAWVLYNQTVIPEDKPLILHSCDHPDCTKRIHLFPGTQQDNITDMIAKGRGNWAHGVACSKAKLTDEIALAAYYDPRPCPEIARDLGVTNNAIHALKKRRTWKHIHLDAPEFV